jgi:hypothetical protein
MPGRGRPTAAIELTDQERQTLQRWVDGAVADVVVAGPGRCARQHWQTGWVRSSAWMPVFSSMQSTTARSGGFRYSPTTSWTLSTKCGSEDSLNDS